MIGQSVGPYQVLSKLGEGGMGEVYLAHDSRLKRDVAIKILPDVFAADPDRLARFEREAQTLASLNHPHIAHIYGLETVAGGAETRAIVMELVEGEDLEQRLARLRAPGASARQAGLPIDEALSIARQIAEALEAAHEQGIVHRDLKPANIKVRQDGTVKVLDFGLAKAFAPTQVGATHASPLHESPTITSPAMTMRGTVLGTAAYMAPEQVRGSIVDRRADIWAFGCVLFELLTAERVFDGQTVADVLADVLRKDIAWTRLPVGTPHAIQDLLRRCLTRDPRARLRDMGDARLAIEEQIANPTPAAAHASQSTLTASAAASAAWLKPALAIVTFVALAAAALAAWALTRPEPPAAAKMHATVALGDGITSLAESTFDISPDGRTLAFVGRAAADKPWQLFVRRFDERQARPIAGTEGMTFSPFFSPDGRSLGFFANGDLKTVPVAGGAVRKLADAQSDRGGWWAADGTIFFTPDAQRGGVLMRVSAEGGAAAQVTKLHDREVTNRWPQALPGGKGLLYTAHSQTGTYDNASLVVSSLAGDQRKVVQERGYFGRYLASGHLAYIHKGTLFVAPFDLERLAVTGAAVPFLEGVTADPTSGAALFDFADDGTLVYQSGPGRTPDVTIAWLEEGGKERPMRTTPGDYASPRFSPDGTRLAVDIGASWGEAAIWSYDWARDTMALVSKGNGEDNVPVWSPDGSRIAFAGQRDGGVVPNIYIQRADGTGSAERVVQSDTAQLPFAWHPGGRLLAFHTVAAGPFTSDIGIVPLEGDPSKGWKAGKPSMVLSEPYVEGLPAFSPDGRWLAYTSFESGQPEVNVRPFPGLETKVKVSTADGAFPMWSQAKPELFYSTDGAIFVVSWRTAGAAFVPEKPRLWAPLPAGFIRGGAATLALHPDGKRFAVLKGPPPPERPTVSLMTNAFDELRRVLQAAR